PKQETIVYTKHLTLPRRTVKDPRNQARLRYRRSVSPHLRTHLCQTFVVQSLRTCRPSAVSANPEPASAEIRTNWRRVFAVSIGLTLLHRRLFSLRFFTRCLDAGDLLLAAILFVVVSVLGLGPALCR